MGSIYAYFVQEIWHVEKGNIALENEIDSLIKG
jgi:hypothetical protein